MVPDNKNVKILPGHVALNAKVGGVNNWGKAIFCSPNLQTSMSYSQKLQDKENNQVWGIIFEVRVRPKSYNTLGNISKNVPNEIRVDNANNICVLFVWFIN